MCLVIASQSSVINYFAVNCSWVNIIAKRPCVFCIHILKTVKVNSGKHYRCLACLIPLVWRTCILRKYNHTGNKIKPLLSDRLMRFNWIDSVPWLWSNTLVQILCLMPIDKFMQDLYSSLRCSWQILNSEQVLNLNKQWN